MVAGAVLALAAPAAAGPRAGMRAWTLDATVGPRYGDATGSNARLSVAWVPWRDLSPSRTDRSWYVSVGAMGAMGGLRYRSATGVTNERTLTLAPELRTGIALRGTLIDDELDDEFLAYLYLSASVGWMRSTTAADDVHDHVATRFAAGLSLPMKRHAVMDASPPRFEASDDHRGEALITLCHYAGALFGLLLPDTIEITWERADGREYTGLAWGYAL